MTRTGWWVAGIVVVVIAGLYLFMSQASAPSVEYGSPSGQTTGQQQTQTTASTSVTGSVSVGTGAPQSATVTYDGSAFSPASVTVAKGGTVTFTDTSGSMWIASNPHPSHTGYDGTSATQHCAPGYSGASPFDECAPGSSFSFTFNKAGTWGYHDHLNHDARGSVVVQ